MQMRSRARNAAILLLSTVPARAQLAQRWVALHDGAASLDDYALDSSVDSKGHLVVTGATTNALGVTEIFTAKFDALGTEVWARTYAAPGGGPDYAFAIAVDGHDDVIVLGDSVGVGTDVDLVTIKYTANGELAWVQRYDGPANGYDGTSGARSLAVDGSDDVIVGGYTTSLAGDFDSIVVKYSPAGAVLWQATYDGPTHGRDYCYGLAVDSAGSVCVTGETPAASGSADFLALKYDASGVLLWQRQYDGPASGSDYVYTIAVGPSDEMVLTGISPGIGTHDDVATVKYDSSGNLQWARRYDGPASKDDFGAVVAIGEQGQVAVTGSVEAHYDSQAITLLYDAGGNLLWARNYDLSSSYFGADQGLDVTLDAAGNAYVAGGGWDGPEFGIELFLLQYAPDGSLRFEGRQDGTVHGDDEAFSVDVHGSDVYVAGLSQGGSRHVDALVAKYGPDTGFTPARPVTLGAGAPAPTFAPAAEPAGVSRQPRSPLPFRPGSRPSPAAIGRRGGR